VCTIVGVESAKLIVLYCNGSILIPYSVPLSGTSWISVSYHRNDGRFVKRSGGALIGTGSFYCFLSVSYSAKLSSNVHNSCLLHLCTLNCDKKSIPTK
jgi:hypothetical protein